MKQIMNLMKFGFIVPIMFVVFSCNDADEAGRIVLDLNEEWFFAVDSVADHAHDWSEKIPETIARKVIVPHTWNIEEGLEEYYGRAWYQKNFHIPDDWKGKSIRLNFGAVNRDAHVYLNGVHVGSHLYAGHTGFSLEVSDQLVFEKENVLVVSVDNSFSKKALPYDRAFDWNNDGGIIRQVALVAADRPAIRYVHVDTHISGKTAVKVKLWDETVDECQFELKIRDKQENRLIDSFSGKKRAEDKVFTFFFDVEQVNLWHFDKPNLYEVEVSSIKNGKVSDRLTETYGYKELIVEGDRLIFNGEPVRLTGVEWMMGSNPAYGQAEPKHYIDSVIADLKRLNTTITRFHWHPDKYILQRMDEEGILVQIEVPWWQQPYDYDEHMYAVHKQHIDEMVEQYYNHVSVFAWALGNEVWGQDERVKTIFSHFKDYTQQLDTMRMLNYVSNSINYGPSNDVAVLSDILTWNEYIGTWHGEHRDELPAMIEQIKRELPDRALMITENGLCEPVFTGGDERRIDELHFHFSEWAKHPFIVAAIYFSYNDYRTHRGEDGEGKRRQRIHGVTTLTGERKPSFHTLQYLSAPIEIIDLQKSHDEIAFTIKVRDSLPKYAVNEYYLEYLENGAKRKLTINNMQPGETQRIILKNSSNIVIYRPTGHEVLKVKDTSRYEQGNEETVLK